MKASPLWTKVVDTDESDPLISCLKNDFTIFVSKVFIYKNLRKLGYDNYYDMSNDDKQKIGEEIISKIYKRYTKRTLKSKKIEYYLQLAIKASSDKLAQQINDAPKVSVNDMQDLVDEKMKDIISAIENKVYKKLVFSFSGDIKGYVLFMIEEHELNKFSTELLKNMIGKIPESNSLRAKSNALDQFFDNIIPDFTESVKKVSDVDISFDKIEYDKLKSAYMYDDDYVFPLKLFKTSLNVDGRIAKIKSDVYFFIDEVSSGFSEKLGITEGHLDPFEISPPKILVEKSKNPDKDIEVLFEMLNLDKKIIKIILENMNKKNFKNFDFQDIIDFNHILIKDYFHGSSRAKKDSIMTNVSNLLE